MMEDIYVFEERVIRVLSKIDSFFTHKNKLGFNRLSRGKLVDSLETIRKNRICCYASPSKMCDCKYGIEDRGGLDASGRGENTGCCEMREAIAILRNMTDREYLKIQYRTVKKSMKEFKKYKKEQGGLFANKEHKRD